MAVEILKNSLSAWQRWTRQQWGEIQWWRRPVVSTASYPPCPPCPPLPLPKVLSRLQLSSSSTISRGLVVWNHQLKLCIVPMLSTSSDTRVTSKKLNSCRKIVKVLSTINGLKDSFHVAITTFLPILIYLLIWEKLYKLGRPLLREADPFQNGWIFGKVPNGLCPPPLIFGKLCCNFSRKMSQKAL